MEAEFEALKEAWVAPGEGFNYSWSNIIVLSVDGVLFVGKVPGKSGQ